MMIDVIYKEQKKTHTQPGIFFGGVLRLCHSNQHLDRILLTSSQFRKQKRKRKKSSNQEVEKKRWVKQKV